VQIVGLLQRLVLVQYLEQTFHPKICEPCELVHDEQEFSSIRSCPVT